MPNELPIEYDPSTGWPLPNQTTAEYVPPVEAKRKNYIIEPDLYGYQTGNYIPEGATIDETGNLFWKDTKEPIQMIRRPTVLPVVGTPDGNELVMPKLLDLAGYVGGPSIAGKVPLKAGETLLGSGAVRTAKEPIYPLAKPSERWVNTTGQNDHLLETMTPDEFLSKGRPLKIDAESRETINGLKKHIEEGKPLDPLELHANGKEDGRHRAIAAKELGIKEVPVLNFREPEVVPAFYSGLEKAVETAKPTIATADQWLGYLRNQPGVKAEELQHVLGELPSGPITKEALGEIVKANKVELKEIVKGKGELKHYAEPDEETGLFNILNDRGDIIDTGYHNERAAEREILRLAGHEQSVSGLADLNVGTKFHYYQLPGGENYKEMLLTLPDKRAAGPKTFDEFAKLNNLKDGPEARLAYSEFNANNKNVNDGGNFQSSHWDEPNVLAHIRMNDRNVEGSKTLHLEEIQSDWHQKGRKEGYKLDPKEKARLDTNAETVDNKLQAANAEDIMGNPDLDAGLKQAVERKIITQKEADDYRHLVKNENGTVPDAPFKKNWDELAFKRAIRHAAENGYEGISWTPGEAQAARYDLSKQIDQIHINPAVGDTTLVRLKANKGSDISLQVDKKGNVVSSFPGSQANQFEGKNLTDVVGKEVAEKIMAKAVDIPQRPKDLPEGYELIKDGKKWGVIPPNQNHARSMVGLHETKEEAVRQAINHIHFEATQKGHILENADLKIGGEGMKAFYDKMLVDKANALAKKYGAKVEKKNLINGEKPEFEIEKIDNKTFRILDADGEPVHNKTFESHNEAKTWLKDEGFDLNKYQPIHYLPLTPELKKKALTEGFPLFTSSPTIIPIDFDPFERKYNHKAHSQWRAR